MPLVEIHKARRKIKKRPEWQDTRPPEKELRQAYDIAARHENRWSLAYASLLRDLITPEIKAELKKRLKTESAASVVQAIPWYVPGDPESEAIWGKMAKKLERAYENVIRETGEDEFKRLGIKQKFVVTKQTIVPVVPVNPFSIEWLEKRVKELLPEISNSAQQTILSTILRGFKEGKRIEAILAEISDPSRLGLLEREEAAVDKRFKLMVEQGVPVERATAAADKYADSLRRKRAKRIARTETVMAQSQGRRDAWQLAVEQGELRPDKKKEWAAATASERTCVICLELDKKEPIGFNERYYSSALGRYLDGPPAHPNCRCVELLVSPE